jgi:hypothetical protein
VPSPDQWAQFLNSALPQVRAELAPGLNDRELGAVEEAAGVALPTELRVMLRLALPAGRGWRNWRRDPAGQLTTWREAVTDGIVFDVKHNDFWDDSWGPRPSEDTRRDAIVRQQSTTLPRLFPVFAHRALVIDPVPGFESADGNPVFSVHQTDVIYYGNDLADWFNHEFGVPLPAWAARQPRRVPFWSALNDPERWS